MVVLRGLVYLVFIVIEDKHLIVCFTYMSYMFLDLCGMCFTALTYQIWLLYMYFITYS